jgi:spore germination protein Q
LYNPCIGKESGIQPYNPYNVMYPGYPYGMMTQPMFPSNQGMLQTAPPPLPSGSMIPGFPEPTGPAVVEESYIENVLRFNRGKIATFYMTYENNSQWNAKIFRGRIETAGRDHIIISDPQTGKRFLLLMLNLDYVEFDEPLIYVPPRIPPNVQAELVTSN